MVAEWIVAVALAMSMFFNGGPNIFYQDNGDGTNNYPGNDSGCVCIPPGQDLPPVGPPPAPKP